MNNVIMCCLIGLAFLISYRIGYYRGEVDKHKEIFDTIENKILESIFEKVIVNDE